MRPDDDNAPEYNKVALKGMRAQKAFVRGAKLYKQAYATVELAPWTTNHAPRPERIENEPIVHGWVLTCPKGLWMKKFGMLSLIEGLNIFAGLKSDFDPKLSVVEVELCEEHIGPSHLKVGEPGET